jgi:hypothetical protein
LLLLWLVKALQTSQFDGGPELGSVGWAPNINRMVYLVYPDFNRLWPEYTTTQRATMSQAYVQQWFAKVQQFTPQQFYQGGWAAATEIPDGNYNGDFANWLYFTIPQLEYFGVDPTLTTRIGNWAKTVWTVANWDSAINATCSWNAGRGLVLCSNSVY